MQLILGGIEASLCLEARRKPCLPPTNLRVIPDSHPCVRAQVAQEDATLGGRAIEEAVSEAEPEAEGATRCGNAGRTKNQLWTSQGSCRIEDRDEYQGESSEGKTRL